MLLWRLPVSNPNNQSRATHELHEQTVAYQRLRESLLASYPSLADDEQALVDTLDGISDLDLAIAAVMRSREDDLALSEALKLRIDDMRSRLSRFEARADAKKAAVFSAMQAAGLRRKEFADFTLSIGAGRAAVRVTDEARVPQDYMKQPPAVPDKALIAQAIKDGHTVAGAELSNGSEILTVKRK